MATRSSLLSLFLSPTSRGAPDCLRPALITLIEESTHFLWVAAQQLKDHDITTALCNARKRGVDVRIAIEGDYLAEAKAPNDPWALVSEGNETNRTALLAMLRSRIGIFIENDAHLMHSNFLVSENRVALTSANLTTTGMDSNYESMLLIEDHRAVEEFKSEFKYICRDADVDHLNSLLQIEKDGLDISILFAPSDNPEAEIVACLMNAKASINIAIFTFSKSSRRIVEALVSAANQGINIKIVLDSDQARQPWAPIRVLQEAGITIKHIGGDGMRMHHKIISIDESVIMIGTYNFSATAQESHETLITIKSQSDGKDTSQEFAKYANSEILRIYEIGKPIDI